MGARCSVLGFGLLAACGGGGSGDDTVVIDAPGSTLVDGVIEIVHGPAGTSTAAHGVGVPADGNWVLTPDGGRATVVSLSFLEAGGLGEVATLTDCVPEYHRGDAALSAILDCPFSIRPGTYVGFGVNMSTTFEVLVDDAVNGLFTDPAATTGLTTTPPAGGAAYVTVDLGQQGPTVGLNYFLADPLVIEAGSAPTLTIVADMIQTTQVQVAAGVPSFRTDGVWQPMILFGSPTGIAAAEYYNELGIVGSYNSSNPPVTNTYVRLYYGGAGAAEAAFLAPGVSSGTGAAYAVDPATLPDVTGGKAGGYLARDAADTVCWAAANDFTWQTYLAVFSMPRGAGLGDAVTLTRDDVTTAPPPGPDGTYAAGCPAVTADGTYALTLVAR